MAQAAQLLPILPLVAAYALLLPTINNTLLQSTCHAHPAALRTHRGQEGPYWRPPSTTTAGCWTCWPACLLALRGRPNWCGGCM